MRSSTYSHRNEPADQHLETTHSYGNGKIERWVPEQTIPQGSCDTVKLTLGPFAGISLEEARTICAEKLEPTLAGEGSVFGVDWRGTAKGAMRYTELLEVMWHGRETNYTGFKWHMAFASEPECPRFEPAAASAGVAAPRVGSGTTAASACQNTPGMIIFA